MRKLLAGTPIDWLVKSHFPIARTWEDDRQATLDSLAKVKGSDGELLALVGDPVYSPVGEVWEERGVYLYTVRRLDRTFHFFQEEFRKVFGRTLKLTGNPHLAWNHAYDETEHHLEVHGEDPPEEELRKLAREGSVLAFRMREATAPFRGKRGLYVLFYRSTIAYYKVGRDYDRATHTLAESLEAELTHPWPDNAPVPDWGPYVLEEGDFAKGELLESLKYWAEAGQYVDLQDGVTPEEIRRIRDLRLVWGWGMGFGHINPDTYEFALFEAVLEEA